MNKSLFRTKKIENIIAEGTDASHGGGLKRVLTVKDLTFLELRPFSERGALVAWEVQFLMEVRVLWCCLLLLELLVLLLLFAIRILQVEFLLQEAHTLMRMLVLESCLHG